MSKRPTLKSYVSPHLKQRVADRSAATHRSESQLIEFVMTNYLKAPDQVEKMFRQIVGQQQNLAAQPNHNGGGMVRP